MTDKKEEILWKYEPATMYSSAITFTQEDCYKAMTEYADLQSKERDFIIKKKDEIIESQKQTFDSLLKKYEAIDKEYGETIEKLSEKFESSITTKDKEIEELEKQSLRQSQTIQGCQSKLSLKDTRIKELEEGLKKIRGIIFLDNYKNPMNNTDMYNICESLLNPSKEQKEEVKGSRAERRKVMQTITIEYGERFLLRARHLNDYAETEVEVGEIQIPSEKGSLQKITRLHCLRF